jgi:hypothetical protein
VFYLYNIPQIDNSRGATGKVFAGDAHGMKANRSCKHIGYLQTILISGVGADNILEWSNTVFWFAGFGKLHSQPSAKRWCGAIDGDDFIGNVQLAGTKGQLDY